MCVACRKTANYQMQLSLDKLYSRIVYSHEYIYGIQGAWTLEMKQEWKYFQTKQQADFVERLLSVVGNKWTWCFYLWRLLNVAYVSTSWCHPALVHTYCTSLIVLVVVHLAWVQPRLRRAVHEYPTTTGTLMQTVWLLLWLVWFYLL